MDIFHQGGGWCTDSASCLARASTNLGSSKKWGPSYTDKYEGSALFATPPFNDFNVIYANYCDGGSWAGNSQETVNGTVVYYRGRLLLDALLAKAMDMGLSKADQLLYSGCSAGGLTAYLHTDYVRSKMPTAMKVLGLADAMFSLEHDGINGPVYQPRMQWVFSAMNTSASMNDDCVSAMGKSNGWKCLFGANVAPHVETPMFILNSKYDTWQEKAILGLNCSIGKCINATDEQFWISYGKQMLAKLAQVPSQHGAFITNCAAHCQTGTGGDWTKRSVNGVPMSTAAATWYNATIQALSTSTDSPAAQRWVEACDEKPCGADVC